MGEETLRTGRAGVRPLHCIVAYELSCTVRSAAIYLPRAQPRRGWIVKGSIGAKEGDGGAPMGLLVTEVQRLARTMLMVGK
ncbi:hypothetical protein MBLL_00794 (plasmid) [Methylobacterium bullatum]|uniref:Uncharacterized protein n=1 Tax=Methylobacterium bullatum TaxID=570505 RepID=A0A679K097_9HYPH|nr:hypothetical protein MBLL_00794 [Methylobacterium bullatum]